METQVVGIGGGYFGDMGIDGAGEWDVGDMAAAAAIGGGMGFAPVEDRGSDGTYRLGQA